MTREVPFWVAAAAVGLLVGAMYIPPMLAPVEAHDFLDSFFSWFIVRSRQEGFFFDLDYVVPDILIGMRLNALALGDLSIGPNLYLVLPPAVAFVASEVLLRLCAVVGTYVLVRDHILPRAPYALWIAAATAFSFAALPHKSYLFGSGVYLPLLGWAAINLWKGDRRPINWLIIAIYPFYSFTFYGGLSVIAYMAAAAAAAFVLRKPGAMALTTATALIIALYAIVEIRLFYHWLFADYAWQSTRSFELPTAFEIAPYAMSFFRHFVFGNDTLHFSFHFPILLPAIFVAWVFAGWRYSRAQEKDASVGRLLRVVAALVGLLVLNSVIHAEETNFKLVYYLFGLPLNLARSDVASPAMWWVAFAAAAWLVAATSPLARRFVVPALLAVVAVHSSLQFPGVKQEIKSELGIPQNVGLRAALAGDALGWVGRLRLGNMTVNEMAGLEVLLPDPEVLRPDQRFRSTGVYPIAEYFEVEAFSALAPLLAQRLGDDRSAYRVFSIGLSPAVPIYHGYFTLDGYFVDQPIEHWLRFAAVFTREAEKSGKSLQPGNGTFAYVSPASFRDGVIDPDLDMCLLDELGGKVIFSLFPFADPERLGIELVGQSGVVYAYARIEDRICGAMAAPTPGA